jgi:hypothetical protein
VYEQQTQTPTAPQAPAVDAYFSGAATTTAKKAETTLALEDETESDSTSDVQEPSFEDLSDDFFARF